MALTGYSFPAKLNISLRADNEGAPIGVDQVVGVGQTFEIELPKVHKRFLEEKFRSLGQCVNLKLTHSRMATSERCGG